MLPASIKLKQLVVGAVNPRLTQFDAALTLALFIGAVVGAAVLGVTLQITTTCQRSCSGLPLHIAARGDAGECETAFVEEDLSSIPVPQLFKGVEDRLFEMWNPYGDGSCYDHNLDPIVGQCVEIDGWLDLKLKSMNGTVSAGFELSNLKCELPNPTSLQMVAERILQNEPGYKGTLECIEDPYCWVDLVYPAHSMYVEKEKSVRFRVMDQENYDLTTKTQATYIPNGEPIADLTCCQHSSDKPRRETYTNQYTVDSQEMQTWYKAQLAAEGDEMICLHFDLQLNDLMRGQGIPLGALQKTYNLPKQGKGWYDRGNWTMMQNMINNLTASNENFVNRMKAVQKKAYVYCCKDICPDLSSALGSALGYANYVEIVVTVIAIIAYMRVFGGTMTDANGNGVPVTFKQIISIANEEEEDTQKTATP
jgi:hypothetical protein